MSKKNETLSLQKIFDKAAVGMLRQGRKSQNGEPLECRYRGADNCKCAVGFLIDDEYYDPYMEGPKIVVMKRKNDSSMEIDPEYGRKRRSAWKALQKSGVDTSQEDVLELLGCLQRIHDICYISEWPRSLLNLAQRYSLSTKSIQRVIDEKGLAHG